VDLVDSSTQAFWPDEMTLIQSEFGKVFFIKVVVNYLLFPLINFQRIWITRARDMTKIPSSASGGSGGQPSCSYLDEMSLLTSELKQVVPMKVFENCLILPPTKFDIIWPPITPAMGKILSSVWARLQDRFFFFVVKL
jgi:hypothetical protein